MTCRFGIVPDGSDEPSAVFQELEDALSWALAKFGPDRFSIRRCSLAEVAQDDASARLSSVN
ncbi:MAG: hypothetical protein KA712_15725 [Myxococcales bacterium]|nr:hypothetical protein [Myxococcales bacterium]